MLMGRKKEMEIKKDPTSYATFIFAAELLITWACFSGIFTGECYLYLGLFCLACFPVYFQAAKDYMAIGDLFNATLYHAFGFMFGIFMGPCYVAQFLDGIFGWGLEYNFVSTVVLIGAVYLIPIVISALYTPWSEFLTWLLVDVVMLAWGVSGYVGEALGGICFMVCIWLCLVSGILLLYMSLVAVMKPMGINLPVGKPILQYSQQ